MLPLLATVFYFLALSRLLRGESQDGVETFYVGAVTVGYVVFWVVYLLW